jgi:hypothetical protein
MQYMHLHGQVSLSMIIVLIEDGFQDLLMDWSLFQRKSPHPFLRPELLYKDRWPVSALAAGRLPC